MAKDVKYDPADWQAMKTHLDQFTGGRNKDYSGARKDFLELNEIMEDIESTISELDSDNCIHFTHISQENNINNLFDDYEKLADFSLKAGDLVATNIDKPFYNKIDAFADKMKGLSIHRYTTKNRLNAKETTTVGYGDHKDSVQTEKAEINYSDIVSNSQQFTEILEVEYNEFIKRNPNVELSQSDFTKAVVSKRGFEYKSISDVQKEQEMWRDLLITGAVVIVYATAAILCPPAAGTILTVASGTAGSAHIRSAIEGEDWGTHRKLDDGEKFERFTYGVLELAPTAFAFKNAKYLQFSNELSDVEKAKDIAEAMNKSGQLSSYQLNMVGKGVGEGTGNLRQISSGGLRNEIELTNAQKSELVDYAKSLGFPEENIVFRDSWNTGMMYDRLYINTDVLPGQSPGIGTLSANSRVSGKATIAHEIVGHYEAYANGKAFNLYDIDPVTYARNFALDEAQASIRAARFSPDLTSTERMTLLRDAITRLKNGGLRIRDVKDELFIQSR
ncbi:hypothetical protein PJ311_16155 [Bacillus sp. CLL-7-23]|uniref:Uncharacterized protein n=1 Tax=Bacillus changyiensis TaxID=3004103 RepID=A0ABT4X767_9BACI|nr:hypothetical protein [Bacillus changyiensis]MDA7028108.1 hypothetical protein [Bacillus changyiensis]